MLVVFPIESSRASRFDGVGVALLPPDSGDINKRYDVDIKFLCAK